MDVAGSLILDEQVDKQLHGLQDPTLQSASLALLSVLCSKLSDEQVARVGAELPAIVTCFVDGGGGGGDDSTKVCCVLVVCVCARVCGREEGRPKMPIITQNAGQRVRAADGAGGARGGAVHAHRADRGEPLSGLMCPMLAEFIQGQHAELNTQQNPHTQPSRRPPCSSWQRRWRPPARAAP